LTKSLHHKAFHLVWRKCNYQIYVTLVSVLVLMFRIVFWDVLPCKIIVDRRFRGAYCLHHHPSVHPRRQFWTSYSLPWELEISHSFGFFLGGGCWHKWAVQLNWPITVHISPHYTHSHLYVPAFSIQSLLSYTENIQSITDTFYAQTECIYKILCQSI
jgi:hypothetical protein